MRYKLIIAVISAILTIGLIGSIALISGILPPEIDVVYMNQVVKLVEQNQEYVGEKVYDYQIANTNQLDYQDLVNQAIKNRDTIIDITADRSIIGKVIFRTNFNSAQKQQRQNLTLIITSIFIMLLITCLSYIIYLQNSFYKPFFKLQRFAKSIAAGNLDIPLTMEKSNTFGAFTESFDIMREELKQAKHKENLANISKRELIASLSHDIKTPVASIKAVSELLLAITDDEKQKPKLNTIYEKAEQIDSLITNMFHATLEELGELKVNPAEEYSTIIYELIKNADYEAKATPFTIPECIIKADRLRLGQVIDNVVANSYKYAGTPIDITCRATNTHLELDIQDLGSGVNEDELPLLFNKFYRGSNVGKQSGSGLGLYISKFLMQKQGGDMLCYNHPNGFGVKIIIPLA